MRQSAVTARVRLAVLAALLATAAGAQERVSVELRAPAGGDEHPITVSFDGLVYSPPRWFDIGEVPDEAAKGWTAGERFILRVLAANAGGEAADVLALWLPDDRPKIRTLAEDSKLFAQNQRFFTSIQASALRAKLYYGAYTLFFIQHKGPDFDLVQVYPVIKQGEERFMTNALQSDPVYVYLSTAYAKQLPLEERPDSDENR